MFARLMGLSVISPAALQQRMQQHEPITVIDVNSHQGWLTARVPAAPKPWATATFSSCPQASAAGSPPASPPPPAATPPRAAFRL